jgi:GTP pyrophosphokinase/guanosine-3',5'-bis(diphosphate) 3'-pyrophosphohydrolase
VALRTELRSGDVVEVVTSANARPNPAWLNSVRTGRARSKIRHYLKNMEQDESRAMGEKMLSQALRAEGLLLPGEATDDPAAVSLWQQMTRWSGNRNRSELLSDIGLGRKIAHIVARRLVQLMAERGVKPDAMTLTMGLYAPDDSAPTQGVVTIDGSEGASVQLAPCCRPIPGDEIVGYLGRGEGLIVHTADCPTAARLRERDSERWMQVAWADELGRSFKTGIVLELRDGKGVLAEVAAAISGAGADILHLDMGAEPAAETTELRLLIGVRDRVHLAEVLRTLQRSRPVLRAWRGKR